MRKTDSEKYKEDHEHIIDAAMIFMSQPEVFWNLAPINVKKHVQSIIFPEGLVFDFDEGYRTPILAKSYLLQNKIAQMGDSESNLVVATGNDPVTSSL